MGQIRTGPFSLLAFMSFAGHGLEGVCSSSKSPSAGRYDTASGYLDE